MLFHIVHYHVRGDDFSLGHDVLLFETCEQLLGERAQEIELSTQELFCGNLGLLLVVEFFDVFGILLLQTVNHLVGAVGVLLVEVVGNFHQ